MLHDLTEYLALYCKYPAVEYLWKMGFGRWLREREQGGGDYFRRLVNLRAKEPKKLFRGLGKADVRLLRNETLSTAAKYSCLKRAGAAEEKLDKVKNPAAHKVNFLFGEVRGLVERLEQALAELQQSEEAAREKFAKVIADWLCKEGDRLA